MKHSFQIMYSLSVRYLKYLEWIHQLEVWFVSFLLFQWYEYSIQPVDQGAGVWLAGGLRTGPVCQSHQAVGWKWTDTAGCLTSGLWEGQGMRQQIWDVQLSDGSLGQRKKIVSILNNLSSLSSQEMGMKHPLHRKKLQLALHAFTTKVIEKSSELDYIWVTRESPSFCMGHCELHILTSQLHKIRQMPHTKQSRVELLQRWFNRLIK